MINVILCFTFSSLSFVVAQVFVDTCVLFMCGMELCSFSGRNTAFTASEDFPLGKIRLSPLILH